MKNNGITIVGFVIFLTMMMGMMSLSYINEITTLNDLGMNDSAVVNIGVIVTDGEIQFVPVDTSMTP